MIKLHNLTKTYDDIPILENTSYTFPATGFVCLLGESGCGKTTLMKLLAGFDTTYTGEICIDGVNLSSMSNKALCNYRKDYIGFIFQDYHLMNGYSVLENVLYPCVLKWNPIQKDREKAIALLQQLGLLDKLNERIENLSGGQKQRVAIARALIKDTKILLADEPTASLDRQATNEILEILKTISTSRLLIVVTHNHTICRYADEVITIEESTIKVLKKQKDLPLALEENMLLKPPKKIHFKALSLRNFKVHFIKYAMISIVFSIGMLCFLYSLSSNTVLSKSIDEFKSKNVAFNNGYIKNDFSEFDQVYTNLLKDKRLTNVYQQYKVEDITLTYLHHKEFIKEKYPMPKTAESISYGRLPQNKKNEIAITPSLAKKFSTKINELVGKAITLTSGKNSFTLRISGIYNASYDDFFVSNNIEQILYQDLKGKPCYSFSYDVIEFEDIIKISDMLLKDNIVSENASEQVNTLLLSFHKLQSLFISISSIIVFICIFIIIIMLLKIRSLQYRTIGLLYSFGFQKNMISKLTIMNSLLLTLCVTISASFMLLINYFIIQFYQIDFQLTWIQLFSTILCSSCLILFINIFLNKKLLASSPALLLNK